MTNLFRPPKVDFLPLEVDFGSLEFDFKHMRVNYGHLGVALVWVSGCQLLGKMGTWLFFSGGVYNFLKEDRRFPPPPLASILPLPPPKSDVIYEWPLSQTL